MPNYNINFDNYDYKGGPLPTATIHLANSRCQPPNPPKSPDQGEWIFSRFLPQEGSIVVKDSKNYTVWYCKAQGRGCMRDS